jgi:hypothetical protein
MRIENRKDTKVLSSHLKVGQEEHSHFNSGQDRQVKTRETPANANEKDFLRGETVTTSILHLFAVIMRQ